jgi:hypothetical protein
MRVALMSLLVLGVAACGPSAKEIRYAETTVYTAAPNQILDVAVQVAQRTYQVADIDPMKHAFVTEGQWYSPEGARRGTTNEGNGDYVNARGGDVKLTLEVKVLDMERTGTVAVNVVPHTFQLVAGSPQPRELKPDDPNLPPWIHGRVDQLWLDIYNASKQFANPH